MINANELRIGNWVKFKHLLGFIITIKQDNCEIQSDRIIVNSSYDDIIPIPLTPEILEKCGFEKEDIETHTDKTTRGLYKSILMMLPATSNCWYAAPFGYPLSLHRTLYLHQLQNLYFALTGEELIYKP